MADAFGALAGRLLFEEDHTQEAQIRRNLLAR